MKIKVLIASALLCVAPLNAAGSAARYFVRGFGNGCAALGVVEGVKSYNQAKEDVDSYWKQCKDHPEDAVVDFSGFFNFPLFPEVKLSKKQRDKISQECVQCVGKEPSFIVYDRNNPSNAMCVVNNKGDEFGLILGRTVHQDRNEPNGDLSDETKFLLSHECAHFTHGDTATKHKLDSLRLVTIGIVWRTMIVRNYSLIGGAVRGIGTALGSALLLATHSQHSEHRADVASSDPDVLRGGVRFFKDFKEKEDALLQDYIDSKKDYWEVAFRRLFHSHPSSEKRIERLEKRIEELEK